MSGFLGDYGEGFLGLGYSQSSLGDGLAGETTRTFGGDGGVEEHSSTSEQGAANVRFLPATGIDSHAHDPKEETQDEHDIQEKAKLARLKAMDIVRSILQGDSGKSHETPPNDNRVLSNESSPNNHDYGYYGPANDFQRDNHNMTQDESPAVAVAPNPPTMASLQSTVEEARLKAMKVLQKFQQVPSNPLLPEDNPRGEPSTISNSGIQMMSHDGRIPILSNHAHPILIQDERPGPANGDIQNQPQTIPAVIPDTTLPVVPPWEMAKRRRKCLDWLEERKQHAMLRNLAYVARIEEERLAQQLNQVQQIQTLESEINERYHQKLAARTKAQRQIRDGRNNINTSAAGIGTKQRQKAERTRKRAALPPSMRNPKADDDSFTESNGSRSIAIYVSNIPTDGSVSDATIEALFGSYGNLRKMHHYVDRSTGRRKGDALALYSIAYDGHNNMEEEESRLINQVCSQVNGCELPCGAILGAQPSDPNHKVTAKIAQTVSQQPHPSPHPTPQETLTAETSELVTESNETGGDEDLDDFFASLE